VTRPSGALAEVLGGQDGELAPLRASVRSFVDDRLIPREIELETTGTVDAAVWDGLVDQARSLGVWALNYPVEAGGPGMPLTAQVIVRQEIGRTTMGMSRIARRPPLALLAASSARVRDVGLRAARGDAEVAFAMTEASGGSSLRALSTTFTVGDDGVRRVSGEKHFITAAPTASHLLVVAKDASVPGRFTAALLDADQPGIEVRPRAKMGWTGWPWGDIVLDGVEVCDDDLVGAPGDGLAVAMGDIEATRVGVSAHYLGTTVRALELLTATAALREVSGGLLADQQGFRWRVAGLFARLTACNELVFSLARAKDAGERLDTHRISSLKWLTAELAYETADFALQTAGAGGFQSDTIENILFRDARAFRIGEGTSELQLESIARGVLGRAG
jgi:acyl-CoA dehydrogenase